MRHCSASGFGISNSRIVWASFASTTQQSCATVIESLLTVASLVWNRRIVLGGPEWLGTLELDLSQLSIRVPSQFDRSEKVVSLCRPTIIRRTNHSCNSSMDYLLITSDQQCIKSRNSI